MAFDPVARVDQLVREELPATLMADTFDTACECGCSLGIPIVAIAEEFRCPQCGLPGQLAPDQVRQIQEIIHRAVETARLRARILLSPPKGSA